VRVDTLAQRLELPLLVTNPVNVRYLIGLHSSNAALLVDPESGPPTIYSDFRYAEKARALEGVEFVETSRYLLRSLAELLAGRRVGFEETHLTVAGQRTLAEGIDLVPTSGHVESMRVIKDDDEIAAIRRAGVLSDEIFGALAKERFVGRTERELVWWVERSFREAGAQAVAFSTIVAAGPTGAFPHADPGDLVIVPGMLVTVDAGCVVDGYCSDCTRTFSTGDLPESVSDAYSLCLEAQLAGLAAVRPGVSGRDADDASRELIEAAGLGWAYGHGLGHGVGLQVHEAPVLRPESTDVLEPGNVVTVEPGIYIPGEGGVRIEDLVLVTADGCERLTQFPKELITVS
jgi:Xaa-Pro aminopeptidase